MQLRACIMLQLSYSCMQTITGAIFYILQKTNRSRNFFFRGGFLSFRGESPFAPVYFEGWYIHVDNVHVRRLCK